MDARRSIPSVDRLLASEAFRDLLASAPRELVVQALQRVQSDVRARIAAGEADGVVAADDAPAWYAAETGRTLEQMRRPSLIPVINATGVVLHTNLGRAPLADAARAAVDRAARGYVNLEYDMEEGRRGSRYVHCTQLLVQLTGAEAALVVNNNAAALVLVLNTLALDREVVVSRGELVEIGGSFRVPEILARSGARLREVGSTNRTHARDYAAAMNDATAVLLKVHPSNFRTLGFTAEATVPELVPIAAQHGVVVVHDLGSGMLLPGERFGLPHEPTLREALEDGAAVVTSSGDKLLGGPQAGLIVGRADLIEQMRKNPLCRALRVDKLTLAALEATLALYLDPDRAVREIPTLRMLALDAAAIGERAERLAAELRAAGIDADVADGRSAVGGGAFPLDDLPTRLVRIHASVAPQELERRLRANEPPVIARVSDDRLVVDLRTVPEEAEATLRDALRRVVA